MKSRLSSSILPPGATLPSPFLPGAPMVAWAGAHGSMLLRVVWCGHDARFGTNCVCTTAAAVACYAAVGALFRGAPPPELVISAGTAGGFAASGARLGDVYLGSKCVFHARRMSNAIIVADGRAIERYLGLHPARQVGAPDALHPIDERAGY